MDSLPIAYWQRLGFLENIFFFFGLDDSEAVVCLSVCFAFAEDSITNDVSSPHTLELLVNAASWGRRFLCVYIT